MINKLKKGENMTSRTFKCKADLIAYMKRLSVNQIKASVIKRTIANNFNIRHPE